LKRAWLKYNDVLQAAFDRPEHDDHGKRLSTLKARAWGEGTHPKLRTLKTKRSVPVTSRFGGYEDRSFLAELYDLVPAYTLRRDVDFYLGVCQSAPARVLELGCGTGRILIPAARKEYRSRNRRTQACAAVLEAWRELVEKGNEDLVVVLASANMCCHSTTRRKAPEANPLSA
jgi:SAM-dependent methyltransferase